MMTDECRSKIFFLERLISQDELGGLIARVVQKCSPVTNRTQRISQLYIIDSFRKLETFLTKADLQLESLMVHPTGRAWNLPVDFYQSLKASYFERFRKIAANKSVYRFTMSLKHRATKRHVHLMFDVKADGYRMSFSEGEEIPHENLAERFEWLTYLIKRFSMPVELKMTVDSFTLKHLEGGDVGANNRTAGQGPKLPGGIKCSFPYSDAKDFAKRIRAIASDAEFREEKKEGSWDFRSACCPPNARMMFDELKKIKMPSPYELYSGWYLEDYSEFRKLALAAKLSGGDASASLMEFELEKGVMCQFDVVTSSREMSKVIFSFDKPEHAARLAALIGVTLKPYVW